MNIMFFYLFIVLNHVIYFFDETYISYLIRQRLIMAYYEYRQEFIGHRWDLDRIKKFCWYINIHNKDYIVPTYFELLLHSQYVVLQVNRYYFRTSGVIFQSLFCKMVPTKPRTKQSIPIFLKIHDTDSRGYQLWNSLGH